VLVTEANSDATVTVSDGASVHAVLGDVMIVAVNTKVISATAQAKGEYNLVAASASWATGLATSHVLVDGSVTSEQGNVVVQSLTSSLGTLSDTYSQIGATAATKLKRKRGDKAADGIAASFSKKVLEFETTWGRRSGVAGEVCLVQKWTQPNRRQCECRQVRIMVVGR
jgi:hypothetical protein